MQQASKADIESCLRKTRWHTEKAARRALTNIRSQADHAMRSSVRPYRCPVRTSNGSHWHLGGEW